jgi:CRP/FNR family transcriptional regulator, cyclic AMP receptor protein
LRNNQLPDKTPDIAVLAAQLGNVPHFRGLAPTDLQAIVAAGAVRRYPAGETVFLEDDPCAGMFVLLAGEVHLYKQSPKRKQTVLAVILPVIMFNEVAVLDGGPNPTSAIAIQDTLVWRIGHNAFQELMKRYPQVGLGLLRVMAERNRAMVAQYYDLSFRSVLARTAKLLLELSQNGEQTINRKENPIYLMAARIATVPEAVSRSLKEIEKREAICLTHSTIEVRLPWVVANLAQMESQEERNK